MPIPAAEGFVPNFRLVNKKRPFVPPNRPVVKSIFFPPNNPLHSTENRFNRTGWPSQKLFIV